MSNNMHGSTKMVLVLVVVVAILIPIALGAVLINGPLSLPAKTVQAATGSTSSSGPSTPTITIPLGAGSGANFSPSTLTVASGTTITFVSDDTAVHNIDFTALPAGATIAGGTPSSNLKDGNSYTVTLTTPGTYTFVCDYHSWMKGTITVTG
jgi:plastocyanin